MMPPQCEACGKKFKDGGGLVQFKDYEPLPDGMCGHPHGLLWFCQRHLPRAQKLTHLDSGEAVRRVKRRTWFGLFA